MWLEKSDKEKNTPNPLIKNQIGKKYT